MVSDALFDKAGLEMWKEAYRWLSYLNTSNSGASSKIFCYLIKRIDTHGGSTWRGQNTSNHLNAKFSFGWLPIIDVGQLIIWQSEAYNIQSICVLCDQEEEVVQHILTLCVFCRELWFRVLAPLGFLICVPSNHDLVFVNWWRRANKRVSKEKGKCFNSVIILGVWLL
jgi:hypothetical protein